jgi:hypothetical protein
MTTPRCLRDPMNVRTDFFEQRARFVFGLRQR